MLKAQNKQVKRRKRIDKKTMIIGVDIGKSFNAIVLMDEKGNMLKKLPKVYNSNSGYEWMMRQIRDTMKIHRFQKVLMGLEPTGHYWRKLAHKASSEQMAVVFVKTTAVKFQRSLDQSNRAKSDIKDAIVVANLIREGKYCDSVVKEDIYQQLRRLVKYRERVLGSFSAIQNRLIAWLDDYFPELESLFSKITSKGLRALLRACPTPSEVRQMSLYDLTAILARASRRKEQAKLKGKQIRQAAGQSIGITEVKESDRIRGQLILDDLDHFEKQKEVLEQQIVILLHEIEYGAYLLSVKGIGIITAAIFLAETGAPKNFHSAKELISYSGLDPFETESGQVFGRKKISKQGRFLLRATLYRMAVSVINHNNHLKKYYKRKIKGNRRYRALNKKEALCAVAIKLVKLLFALIRDKRCYQKQAPADGAKRKVA
jgi:transposase